MTGSPSPKYGRADRLLSALIPPTGCLGSLTLAELRERTALSSHQIRDAADVLINRRYASRTGRGTLKITAAGLRFAASSQIITSGPTGPNANTPANTFRARCWRAIRLTKCGNLLAILRLACTGQEATPFDDARRYLDALTHVGILARRNNPGGRVAAGMTTYILLKDVGPKAPHWNKRQQRVFDPNHQESYDARA